MEKLRDAAGGCACCIAAHRAVFRDPTPVVADNLALLDRVGGEMLELLRTPLTLGELVAAVVERKKLLTHSEMKAARYARSVQCFVEYLGTPARLDVAVDPGDAPLCAQIKEEKRAVENLHGPAVFLLVYLPPLRAFIRSPWSRIRLRSRRFSLG